MIPESARKKTSPRSRMLPATLAAVGLAAAVGLGAPALTSTSVPAIAATQSQPFKFTPTTLADLADQVQPSVVSVVVRGGSDRSRVMGKTPGIPSLPEGHPFREFFERFGQMPDAAPQQRPRPRSMAQGSGFFISEDGFVVTNNHVIDDAEEIRIVTHDGKKHDATLIGTDPKTDLALLKVDANVKFKAVSFAETGARVGDYVVAVGNPFGLGGTVTSGIVSARGREIGAGPYDDFLQIDAAINRGNSGGPTFNLNGDVVGVNTAIFSPSGGNVGIGFAIPSNLVEQVVADLKDDGKVTRGWLGVQIQPVTEDIAESLGLDSVNGAIVAKVTDGSPAEKGGLETGDTILEVNGKTVRSPRDLARKVARLNPKSDAEILILRDGEKVTQTVRIGRMPGSEKVATVAPKKSGGTKLAELGLSLSRTAGEEGVVIANVDPDGPAGEKGLKAGDEIMQVAGKDVGSIDDIRKRIADAESKGRKSVLFLVKSGDDQRFVALPLRNA